jgi:hypothetical protein
MINRTEVLTILDEIRELLPAELREAQWVIKDRTPSSTRVAGGPSGSSPTRSRARPAGRRDRGAQRGSPAGGPDRRRRG